MCTMDYVTHVLGLQGWERVENVNEYMLGIDFNTNDNRTDSRFVGRPSEPELVSCGCQTPAEWLLCESAQAPPPEERRRVEPRKRPLVQGTTTPNAKIRVRAHLL